MSTTTSASPEPVLSRPPFWFRMSVNAGNVAQVAGLLIGAGLLYWAAHSQLSAVVLVVLMILSWLIIYICAHSLGHYVVGRLVGIRFKGYGLRGTDHPESYPSWMRPLMAATPFFTVITDKGSMAKASPIAKALMFAAGETSTSVCALAVALYALRHDLPGAGVLLVVTILWVLSATYTTAIGPKGDYYKALHALRTPSAPGA